MKKLLSSIGAILIGTLGLFCCYMWMKPGISLIQIVCYIVGTFTVAIPVYNYWYGKLKD